MSKPEHNNTVCRCPWLDMSKPDYVAYHDDEWVYLFMMITSYLSFLCLESAQAGLSWYTILKTSARLS